MRAFSASVLATLLPLASAQVNTEYSSGEIKTLQTFQYGKFKARIQGSDQNGTIASLFTFWGGDATTPWSVAEWNEIDVELVPSISETSGAFYTNIIHAYQQMDGASIANFNPAQDWHEYTIEWQPSFIAWSLDGVEVRRETSPRASVDFVNKYQNLFMNFWTPQFSPWQDNRDDSTMPWYTRYDYVEAYSWDSTDGYNLLWRDDFDTIDTSRWFVSDGWTFDQNSSTFITSNVYTEEGNLVLRMHRTDTPPPEEPSNWPPPVVDFDTFIFGVECAGNDDTSGCSSCQDECHRSYPVGDKRKFRSSDAACRCLPKQRAPQGYTYKQRAQKKSNVGLCDGCADCARSYPNNDPLTYNSDEQMPRCRAPTTQFVYDNSCQNLYDMECGADCLSCKWSWPVGDPQSGNSSEAACRCEPSQIKELQWSTECPNSNDGDCGSYCSDCRFSWLEYEQTNQDAVCRCRNW